MDFRTNKLLAESHMSLKGAEPVKKSGKEHDHKYTEAEPHQNKRALLAWRRLLRQRRDPDYPMQAIEHPGELVKDLFRRREMRRPLCFSHFSARFHLVYE